MRELTSTLLDVALFVLGYLLGLIWSWGRE
jgi:hypothetical protein